MSNPKLIPSCHLPFIGLSLYRPKALIGTSLFLLILVSSVYAQQYELRTYSVREGLAQSQAFSLLEDQRGYLWIGTRGGGLSRFDGEEFQTFTTRQGLVNNYVQALHEDPYGHLWIGTDQGACKYDGLRFEELDLGTEIPAMVRAFASDQDRLWLGTDQGLFVYQDSQLSSVSLPSRNPDIFSLLMDEDTLWVGHSKGLDQVGLLDTLSWNLRAGTITDLERDSQGQLWIASYGRGLYRKNGNKFRRSFPNIIEGRGLIFDLMPDEKGHLWLATQDQGAIRINLTDSSLIRLNEANGLPSNHIHALWQDRWGNLWLGSSGGGLSKYFGQQFVHQGEAEGLPDQAVYAVLEDIDCQIWIGAGTQGLARQTQAGWLLEADSSNFPKVKTKTIYQDQQGRMWAGTEGQGLWLKADSQWLQINGTLGLAGNWVRDLLQDPAGYLWVATAGGGLSRLRLKSDTLPDSISADFFQIRNIDLPSRRINCLHLDEKNRIWFGAADHGLGYLDAKRQLHTLPEPSLLSNRSIRCLTQDANGFLWVGTQNGLFRLDLNHPDPLSTLTAIESNFRSTNIYLLSTDEAQDLWIGTEQGVDQATLDPDRQIIDLKHFGYNEGFLGVETCRDAVLRDREGDLWFGTVNGLTKYTPSERRDTEGAPQISMEGISLFYTPFHQTDYAAWVNDWYQLHSGLILPYRQNHLSFDFRAVNLRNPGSVRYQWRLLGWEESWTPATEKSDATYSNLPPGAYTFEVRAANEDLLWGKTPLRASFQIEIPLWQEWWFIGLASLLISLIILALFRLRINRIRREASQERRRLEVENHLLEVEQKALRLQMNPHFIFNALSTIQGLIGEGDHQKARYQLAKFGHLMRQVLENSRQSRISLQKEIQTLEDYLKLERFARGEKFDYNIQVSDELRSDEILIPPLLIQPFAENAIIHGLSQLGAERRGKLEIRFAKEGAQLIAQIQDNGIGREASANLRKLNPRPQTSTALKVVEERLALVAAGVRGESDLMIEDLKNDQGEAVGTLIRLSLPLEREF